MLTGSLNYSEGRFSDGTSMLAIQPLKAVLGLDYDLPKERAGISLRANFLKAKDVDQTRFVKSFYGDEQISQFPYYFFQNAVTVDLFAYVKLAKYFTLRASIMNLTDTRYWLWDDLRQIISPVDARPAQRLLPRWPGVRHTLLPATTLRQSLSRIQAIAPAL